MVFLFLVSYILLIFVYYYYYFIFVIIIISMAEQHSFNSSLTQVPWLLFMSLPVMKIVMNNIIMSIPL